MVVERNTPPKRTRTTPSPLNISPSIQGFLPRLLFPTNPTGPSYFDATSQKRVADETNSSIDWSFEYGKERLRIQLLSELGGIRGLVQRLWDNTIPWIVVVAIGIGTGVLAATLDILTSWLTDLRYGACTDTWWMNKSVCCTGLDVGEVCNAWKTWSDIAGESTHIVIRSILQYGIFMFLAVLFAVTASFFVQIYAPYAFHTGIPEIKSLLGGYIIVDFLSGSTLLIKSIGLPLAVASGLSLGKEGPLVHVACCIGNLMLQPFAVLRGNQARQREILSAAAAAGVSVAFGAPLGGVLFSLEEISTFFPGSTLWQSFVCAIVAAVTLQYIDPYNTGKLVLFQVTTTRQIWRGFELIPMLFLGVLGGLFGAGFIKLNEGWERFRRSSGLKNWPVTEVAVLALFTAVVSYLMLFMRIPSSELVASLFQDCSAVDPNGLCDSSQTGTIVLLLLVTAFAKTILTAITFGASVPAGIFLPSLAIGACVGRATGLLMASLQRAHSGAWIFSNCPADGACISPPVYAVIGAASALGGVTRMTISLVVILFELTGAIDLVLQIMMAVMVSKFTADFFSRDGVYEMWINIRGYPFLNNKDEYRRDTIVAKDIMTNFSEITYLTDEGWTLGRLEALLLVEKYRGFPVVRSSSDHVILGYISKLELQAAIDQIRSTSDDIQLQTSCYFSSGPPSRGPQVANTSPLVESRPGHATAALNGSFPGRGKEGDGDDEAGVDNWINLKPWMDQTPILLNLETPMEIAVAMFQRLGLRSVLFTHRGSLAGILTKMDVHAHLQLKHQRATRRNKSGRSRSGVGNEMRQRRGYEAEEEKSAEEEESALLNTADSQEASPRGRH